MKDNIVICNFKGGTGKSAISHQLIVGYGFLGLEIDPYGSLSERIPDKVKKDDITKKTLPQKNYQNTIFDFGSFDSPKLDVAISLSSLIIVPFIPTIETIQTTVDTLKRIKDYEKPILLICNMGAKQEDIEDAKNVFNEYLGYEIEFGIIPYSIGLQTAINDNVSVKELAERKGLKGFMYRKISESFEKIYQQIKNYIN